MYSLPIFGSKKKTDLIKIQKDLMHAYDRKEIVDKET